MDLNPLGQIDPVVMAAIAVIFLATYAGLRRFFVLPYLAVMQERRAHVREAETARAQADQLITEARADAENLHTEAISRVDSILADARERSAEERRGRVNAATQEATALLEKGRTDLEAARKHAVTTLRTQAVECVDLACQQLIGGSDERTIGEAVDKLLARHVH